MSAYRESWVEIDAGAISHNAKVLSEMVAPAMLCAVVKADGYGHGALVAARAALLGGAQWLAVALVEEGVALRDAGIDAPILLLSEPPVNAMADAIRASLTLTLYTSDGIAAADKAAIANGASSNKRVAVHVKVDTGMHRVGCDADDLVVMVQSVVSSRALLFEGLWSHLAVADQLDDPYTDVQTERFIAASDALADLGLVPLMRHLSNSAGAIANPNARFDMVRCGLALYGYLPAAELNAAFAAAAGGKSLQPAISLRSRVHAVRTLSQGERPSYGRTVALTKQSRIATVPLGYADGVRRSLRVAGAEVLIGGVRRPFAGTITMDQVLIDCGDDETVAPGDEVVFIGRQDGAEIHASEWAECLGTITYEVICGIGTRVPRRVVMGDQAKSHEGLGR